MGAHACYAHHYYTFPILQGDIGRKMTFNGCENVIWSLNNYLGFANDKEIREADNMGTALYGLGYPMGARMMTGNTNLHERLEAELATLVRKEDSFLLNYGYQGMFSIIDSIVDRHDVIIYDGESHACIIDGIRLHVGRHFVFQHNSIADLKKQLLRAEKLVQKSGGGILVITEGIFGMRGDMGKLKEISELKKEHDFTFLVDDAHGIGVMGENGGGTGEHQGVQRYIDIYFGTFAKAFAGIGAFVAGNKVLIDFLRYNMRSQIYAKSLPMPIVYGLLKRIELLRRKPGYRKALWEITVELQNRLREAGLNIGNTQSPVTPVYLDGTISEATALVRDLRENYQVFCSMVVYPVVPKNTIMLRLIPTAMHTSADIRVTVNALTEVTKKLKAGKYKTATELQLQNI